VNKIDTNLGNPKIWYLERVSLYWQIVETLEGEIEEFPEIIRILEDEVYECFLLLDDLLEESS
jgi:hypothetical protein